MPLTVHHEHLIPPALIIASGKLAPAITRRAPIGQEKKLARSRYQKGSVLKIGQHWVGKWREDTISPDGTIRRIQRKATLGSRKKLTKKMAHRELDRFLAESGVNSEHYTPSKEASFREFATKWQTEILSIRRGSTKSSDSSRFRKHLLPEFGEVKMRDIDSLRVQTFISKKRSTLEPKTIKNVVTLLASMWTQARTWKYVPKDHDPFEGLVLPEVKTTEQPFHTKDQLRQIIFADGLAPLERVMYSILGETGIRQGELYGLPVCYIDLEHRVIRIRQSLVRGKIGPVKTKKANRDILISEELTSVIRDYLQNHWKPNPQGLLLTSSNGTPRDPDVDRDRKLHPLLDKLGIPRCGFHAFRHGVATVMDQQGVPYAMRTDRMGHEKPSTTMGYTHRCSEDERKFSETIGKLLFTPPAAVAVTAAGNA